MVLVHIQSNIDIQLEIARDMKARRDLYEEVRKGTHGTDQERETFYHMWFNKGVAEIRCQIGGFALGFL